MANKILPFCLFIFLSIVGCKTRSKLPVVQVQVNASYQHPVQISMCDFFSDRCAFNFIDTAGVKKVFHVIPGQLFSVNNDTNWLLFDTDTITIHNKNGYADFNTQNKANKRYNAFINECYAMKAPLYEKYTTYFLHHRDSIIANENFIELYLSKNDSFYRKKVNQFINNYDFTQKINDDLRHYILEIQKLTNNYYYFTESMPILDSLGLLNKRLNYYINQINRQKISVFSQGDITLLISNIAKQLTKTSISRLKTDHAVAMYYDDIRHYFKKQSISYDYLVVSLFVYVKRKKIQLDRPLYKKLRKETKQSIFFKYIDKSILTPITELKDSKKNKNLYDIQFHSKDLTDILAQYSGKPLLIYFWATWCLPCLKSLPEIVELKKKYPDLNIVYVSVDQSQPGWKSFLFERNMYGSNQFRRNFANQDTIFKKIPVIPKYGLFNGYGNLELLDEINDAVISQYLKKFSF